MTNTQLLNMMKQANATATYSVLEKMAKEADNAEWVTLEGKHRSDFRHTGLTRTGLGSSLRSAGKGYLSGLLGSAGGGLLGALAGSIGGNAGLGAAIGGYAGLLGGGLWGSASSVGHAIDDAGADVVKGIQEGYLRIGKDGKLQIRKDYIQ